jgi:hypothetical protein
MSAFMVPLLAPAALVPLVAPAASTSSSPEPSLGDEAQREVGLPLPDERPSMQPTKKNTSATAQGRLICNQNGLQAKMATEGLSLTRETQHEHNGSTEGE